jgi:hypothetical protein
VELRWDAPAACPDEAALRGQVEAILGAPLAAPRPRPLSVIAVVRDDRGTRSLRIFTVTAEGMRERALRYDRDCALLTRAAAVLIAITIDPTSVGRLDPEALALLDPPSEPAVTPAEPTREAPTSEVPTSEVPTSEVPTSEVPTREAPTSEAPKDLRVKPDETPAQAQAADPVAPSLRVWRPRAGLRALGGLGLGDLPGAGGGASVAAALVFRHLRIELVASLWPGRRARIVGTEAGADFLLWTLGPRVCGVVHAHRLLEVPLCAGLEAGRVRVAGVRLHNNPSDRVTWMAAVLAPSLVVAPWRRLALWISPELVVPATRTSFLVEDIGAIHRAKAAAGRFMVGVELRVP